MRSISPFIASLLVSISGWCALGMRDEALSTVQQADAFRLHGLDPASPLESRVKPTPAAILKMFDEPGATLPTAHVLTGDENRKLTAAFAALPPLHRRILSERLRSVSFLDGMPNTAITSPANPDELYRLFDITIRAGILGEDVSDWMTQRERTCFNVKDSPLSVSVEAGKLDAIFYVLLHEATHVVDLALGITPSNMFTEGVWSDRVMPASKYREPLLEHIKFRRGGQAIAIGKAESVYDALRKTFFASLYGSSNWGDDLAESVTLHHMTEVLKQPYRIVNRKDGKVVYAYEPMKSEHVHGRFGQMKRFL